MTQYTLEELQEKLNEEYTAFQHIKDAIGDLEYEADNHLKRADNWAFMIMNYKEIV